MGVGKSLKSPSAFPPVLLVFVTRSQDSHSLDFLLQATNTVGSFHQFKYLYLQQTDKRKQNE